MKCSLAVILSLLALASADPVKPKVDQLVVDYYYDAYDTTSINLLRAQNRSGIWGMMENTDVDLVVNFNPMATATLNADGNYTCPNDANCKAAKLHACAIKEHEGTVLTNHQIFHFIVCTTIDSVWTTDPSTSVNECINEVNEWPDDFISIEICSDFNDMVIPYLNDYYARRNTAAVTKSPTIFIAGAQNDNAVNDLYTAVCGAFTGGLPAECTSTTTSTGSATGSTTPATGTSTTAPGGAAELISSKVLAIIMLVLCMLRR